MWCGFRARPKFERSCPSPNGVSRPMLQRLRSSLRRGLNRLEAALHSRRHRRALRRVREGDFESVVFVCLGNICRSPFAEYWMRGQEPERAERYTSCGFFDGGRSSPDTAQEVAREFGFRLSDHVSRSVSEIPPGAHLWVVMEAVHARGLVRAGVSRESIVFLGDFERGPIPRRAILDPYGKSNEVFRETYRRIVRCLEVLRETDAP